MGEKCIGESPWVKSLRVKSTYIGQESLGEKSEKPVEEESLGEKYINLKVPCLFY